MTRPDFFLKSVADIDGDWLERNGVSGVLLDLDNTLSHLGSPHVASESVENWIKNTPGTVVVSNSKEPRVKAFCDKYGLLYVCDAKKPAPDGLIRACEMLGVSPERAVMVGDQLFTDVRAARRAGLRCALVDPTSRFFFFTLRRSFERIFMGREDYAQPENPAKHR